MKALFLMFHGFDKANGISKKIHYQVKALKECGLDVRTCYYQTSQKVGLTGYISIIYAYISRQITSSY